MITIDPILIEFVAIAFVALSAGLIARYFKQPSIVAFILAGIVAGPYLLGIVHDIELITHLGDIGVVLLLFFIGMEISISELIKNWKITVLGTLLQIVISVASIWVLSIFLDWPMGRTILAGFVISLSSTAVILKILESKGLTHSKIGRDVLGILLFQDLMVVPMLIIISAMSGNVETSQIALQIIGLVLLSGFMAWLSKQQNVRLPMSKHVENDAELQLLYIFVICFGFALATGLFQLSLALGAFFAGMLLGSTELKMWAHEGLHSFKVFFVALFFVSVGMLINPNFVLENIFVIGLLVLLVFVTNTFINAFIFWWFGRGWGYSIIAGAFLSQIGEFSFFLVSVGLLGGVITQFGYQLLVATIVITLLISPIWIAVVSRFVGNRQSLLASK
jgi:monovalent cation:H+ antiporter-2, CPA2 family